MPIKLPKNATYQELGMDKYAAPAWLGRLGRGLKNVVTGTPKSTQKFEAVKNPDTGTITSPLTQTYETPAKPGVNALTIAALSTLGAAGVTAAANLPGGTLGYRISKELFPLQDRIRWDETAAGKLLEGFSTGLGKTTGTQLSTAASLGAATGIGGAFDLAYTANKRSKAFNQAVQSDEVLRNTPKEALQEIYNTVSRTAPRLAEDTNAVRSILREAATMGSGLDYSTIKNLAGTEKELASAGRPASAPWLIGKW